IASACRTTCSRRRNEEGKQRAGGTVSRGRDRYSASEFDRRRESYEMTEGTAPGRRRLRPLAGGADAGHLSHGLSPRLGLSAVQWPDDAGDVRDERTDRRAAVGCPAAPLQRSPFRREARP